MYSIFTTEDEIIHYLKNKTGNRFDRDRVPVILSDIETLKKKLPFYFFVNDDTWSIGDLEKNLGVRLGPNIGECALRGNDHLCPECDREFILNNFRNKPKAEKEDYYHSLNEEDEDHTEGTWVSYWIVKSGYDWGYNAFFFKNKEDYDLAITLALLGEEFSVI